MEPFLLPPRLKRKSLVALLSLASGMAGDLPFQTRYQIGKATLQKLFGFEIFEPANALLGSAVLKLHPEYRAADFVAAVNNGDVKAIIANIGGFDSAQLLPLINWSEFRKKPKLLVGYSDITALHLAAFNCGVQSYYGPAVLDGFAENGGMHELTKNSFKHALFSKKGKQVVLSAPAWTSQLVPWDFQFAAMPSRDMQQEAHGHVFINFQATRLSGMLLGGCLDTLVTLKNTNVWPAKAAWQGAAFFFETSEQQMSPVEFAKALALLSDEITAAAFLLVGKPKNETYFQEYLALLKALNKPVIFNLNIGHTAPFYTLPYGGIAKVNASKKTITVSNY